jgi:hypothetical protein
MASEPSPNKSSPVARSIAVAELADELETYKQTIFKIAKRLAIQPIKRREPTRGNQLVAFVTEADAAAIRRFCGWPSKRNARCLRGRGVRAG